jgi:hypothetical protein
MVVVAATAPFKVAFIGYQGMGRSMGRRRYQKIIQ